MINLKNLKETDTNRYEIIQELVSNYASETNCTGMRFFYNDGTSDEESDESSYFISGFNGYDGTVDSIINQIEEDDIRILYKDASNIKEIIDYVLSLSDETIISLYPTNNHLMFFSKQILNEIKNIDISGSTTTHEEITFSLAPSEEVYSWYNIPNTKDILAIKNELANNVSAYIQRL